MQNKCQEQQISKWVIFTKYTSVNIELPSNLTNKFGKSMFPGVHLDNSHTTYNLIHGLYPSVTKSSSFCSKNKDIEKHKLFLTKKV